MAVDVVHAPRQRTAKVRPLARVTGVPKATAKANPKVSVTKARAKEDRATARGMAPTAAVLTATIWSTNPRPISAMKAARAAPMAVAPSRTPCAPASI